MFLAGLFITVPYSISYLAFTITANADRSRFRILHPSQFDLS